MLNPTDDDAELPPAEPAEEIPVWLAKQRPEEAPPPAAADASADRDQPATLVEKHKARRRGFERLSKLTSTDETVGADLEPPVNETPPTVGAGVEILPNANLSNETRPDGPDQTILQFLVAMPRRAGERAGTLWQRLTRRDQSTPGVSKSMEVPETMGEPETPQLPGGLEQPSRGSRFKAGAARAWAFSRPILWRGRIGPAFWTVASLLSVTVNVILIAILILLGRQLFFLKKTVVSDKLINGLYTNFALMDQAHIQTTITVSDTILVNDTIPVVFDLPLNQKTTVVLTKDTPVNTTIYLNNAAVPLDLILRDGTELNIKLDMTVPVEQTIPVSLKVPVNLTVPVDIPLNQTQLHKPFVGLQQVVSPYRTLLGELPNSWSEVCKGSFKFICNIFKFK